MLCCTVQGEIELPVVFENPRDTDLPSCIDIYRPVRQNIYAILYGVASDGEWTPNDKSVPCHWLLFLFSFI